MSTTLSPLTPITASQLTQLSRIKHAYFTRPGGYSKGIYQGLNTGIGSNDDRKTVMKNRALIATHLDVPDDKLLSAYQIHSAIVASAEDGFKDDRPQADAIVCSTPGLAIGVLTADCGPVLFADPIARVVGAAHAGWKGAVGGVLEATLAAMEERGAKRKQITAVLGPTISQKNYEVGPEFVAHLVALNSSNNTWLAPSKNQGHAMFDLAGYIVDRLKNAGVSAAWTGHCTYQDENNFYSYRRTTHRSEPDYGRQMSAIALG